MQAHVQAKERAPTGRVAYEGMSVPNPGGVLNQRNGWGCACRVVKVIAHSEGACRLDPVNGPKLVASARGGGAVEVAVGRLHQSGKGAPPIGKPTKIVENGERSAGGDLENHTATLSTTFLRRPIEVSAGGLNERTNRIGSMCGDKTVEDGELTSGSNLENHSITTPSALFRSSVNVRVASLIQCSFPTVTIT